MSAIGGVYARLGRPVARPPLEVLSGAMADLGPDGERFVLGDRVGALFRPFAPDPGREPADGFASDRCGRLLVLDGRLDNLDEIAGRLDVRAVRCPRAPDLVLALFEQDDVAAFAHAIGDFALALWDAPRERLILCCDALGRRPLYYHCAADALFWASACGPLADLAGLSTRLNEDYIADFLVNRPPRTSPYAGVEPVRGGEVVVVDRTSLRTTRYWQLDDRRDLSYRSDDEYERHFEHVFREAVACRLRDAGGPVCCELSGGLDSSSIACVASDLVRRGQAAVPEIRTISYLFDRSSESDETPYIDAVERHLGRRGCHIRESETPLLSPVPSGFAPDLPTTSLCFLARCDALVRAATRTGSRVVLSGVGGDHLFWSDPDVPLLLADGAAGGPVRLIRSAARWAEHTGTPLLRLAIDSLRAWGPAAARTANSPVGDWFDRRFARRTALRRSPGAGVRRGHPGRAARQASILRAMRLFALEPCSTEGYVDRRYPFLDRRVAEFALALPMDQIARPGETRSILRRSHRTVVPEAIRQRRGKAGPEEAFYRALAGSWPNLAATLTDSLVAAHGFVDGGRFLAALQHARHGYCANQSHLLRTLALELWLRSREIKRTGAAAPPGWRQSAAERGPYEENVRTP